jgi:predicted enzyme related to lactoylglutathione lyase
MPGLDLLHALPDGRRSHAMFSLMKAKQPLAGPRQEWMVNWRVVGDLDATLDALPAPGVEIEKPEDYGFGRSAWIKNPEGNPIELYQALKEPGSF